MRLLAFFAGLLILLGIVGGLFWFIIRTTRRADDPAKMLFKWGLTLGILVLAIVGLAAQVGFSQGGAFIVPFVCVIIGIIMSVVWAPHIGAWFAKPLTSLFDGGDADWQPQPLYSKAIAQRKRGRTTTALAEVRQQLQLFPHDFVGQLLLAEIQAEDLRDMDAATRTIEAVLSQPGHAPKNIAYTLNLLADWQLKYLRDPDAARQSVGRIMELLPGTEEAQLASQRLAHLSSAEEMLTAKERGPIALREGVHNIGLRVESSSLRPPGEEAEAEAERLVRELELQPENAETRQRLAILYASHYQRVDLAVEQLQYLIDQTGQPQKQIVQWLNLMADLQIKYGRNLPAATAALEKIMELYPGWAAAEAARGRLNHLALELKATDTPAPVRMGTYEQNLGLKKKSG